MYCCLKPQGLGRLLRYFPLVFVAVGGLRLQKSSENASYSAKRVSPKFLKRRLSTLTIKIYQP